MSLVRSNTCHIVEENTRYPQFNVKTLKTSVGCLRLRVWKDTAYFVLLHAGKVDFKANTEYVIKVQF